MNLSLFTIGSAWVLSLVQLLAALPWLWLLDHASFARRARSLGGWLAFIGATVAGGLLMTLLIAYYGDPKRLEFIGRVYGSILQLQLSFDLVLALLGLMMVAWPKGGTVAMAAFREGYRQPLFWLLAGVVSVALVFSMVIPYFTFGEDFRTMKQLSFDMIKLSTVLFAVIAAATSISEEIEGRTAVTLMSKPVTRRQFLLGKYFGIFLAALALTLLLTWVQNWVLFVKPHFERLEDSFDPFAVEVQGKIAPWFTWLGSSEELRAFLRGVGLWYGESLADACGLSLGFGMVMVMLAIAATLATRLPMIVTLVTCAIIFILGNLAGTLAEVTKKLTGPLQLVNFITQTVDKLLPAFAYFSTDQVYGRETYLPPGQFAAYVGSVFLYSVLFSGMALLVGLFLIEDRDLA